MVSGCCNAIKIIKHQQPITVGMHTYIVCLIHCENCGQVKNTTNITQSSIHYKGKL